MDWISFRKMAIEYCLIRLSGGITPFTPSAKLRTNISIIRESLTHFNLINLPDEQEDSKW